MSKLFGSIKELVRVVVRQNSQEITLDSNSGTTYTADRTIELPPIDANETVLGEAATQTVTNKSINASNNTITNLAHGSEVDSPASGVHGVTGSVVGTTDTQTLTSKSLTGPEITDYATYVETAAASVATPTSGKVNKFLDNADGTFKYKDSAGDTFDLGSGSGAGEINAIENPDAESNTEGWAAYADAAGTDPVDGTGGSPSVSINRTTTGSEILRGSGSFELAKDAADRQGEGASYDFTLDAADTNRLLKITFEYTTSASYASEDIGVYIYDVTNATLISPSNNALSIATNGRASFSWVSTDSTSYRLIFHIKTTNASAYDFFFDNVIVGPGNTTIADGAIVTEWTDFTPTWTNGGTTGTEEWRWRRVGSSMEIQGQTPWTGAGTAATLRFDIPEGVTSDLSAVNSQYQGHVGSGGLYDSSAGSRNGARFFLNDSTTIAVATEALDAILGSELGNGDVLTATITVPIAEWASTGTVILPTTDDLALTAPQSYTSTITNFNSTQNLFYWREGSNMRITGALITSGYSAASTIQMTIPAGYTMDFSKLGTASYPMVGTVAAVDSGSSGWHTGRALAFNTATDTIVFRGDDGASLWNSAVPFTWAANSDEIHVDITVPIEEWADLGKVPAVGIQEATADAPGTVKANKWQKKTLSADVASITNPIADLGFSGLETGKVYRVSYTAYLSTTGSSTELTRLRIYHDGTNVGSAVHRADVGADEHSSEFTTIAVFTATTSTVTVGLDGFGAFRLNGNGTFDETWAMIEELNNYEEETTDFT